MSKFALPAALLVEVPSGESLVEMRYAPASLRIGAALSALTVAGLISFRWLFPARWRGCGASSA